jgi:predicted acylesterase/phospholipase RssA
MYSRSPGRQHIHDDKSVPEAYYKPEGVHDHVESVSHTNLSVQAVEPESYRVDAPSLATSDTARKKRSLRIPPRRLALSGGGVRAVAHVGALKVLEANGYLRCLDEIMGVSAGALFALMVTLGYTLSEIETLGLQFDFTMLRNPDADVFLLFHETFGMDRGDSLERLLASILRHKGYSAETTFADISTLKPRFRCFATDIDSAVSREFSAAVSPGVRVIIAVRASMSIPIYYTPVTDPETGALLMDGGVIDNVPIGHIPFVENCWSLLFTLPLTQQPRKDTKNDISQVLTDMYASIVANRYTHHMRLYTGSLIKIPCGDVSPIHFDITVEERQVIIECAAKATENFLFTPDTTVTRRRFSAS